MTKTRMNPGACLLPLAAAVLLSAIPARASMVITVDSSTVTAGTSAFIDINILHTGADENIAGFNLAVIVAGSGISFTGGDTSTVLPYIFFGDSFDLINSFSFTTVPPPNGQAVQASDLSNSGSGTTMSGLLTLGLGRLSFDVAPGTAPGVYAVTIVPDCVTSDSCTSLADSNFNDIPFTVANGSITVDTGRGGAAPEPSTFLLALLAAPALALWRRRSIG